MLDVQCTVCLTDSEVKIQLKQEIKDDLTLFEFEKCTHSEEHCLKHNSKELAYKRDQPNQIELNMIAFPDDQR